MCLTFKEDTRKGWALVITILSGVVLLCGIAMVALSTAFYTKDDDMWSADLGEVSEDFKRIKQGIFGCLLTFSLIALFTGVGGMTCGCGPCKPGGCWHRVWPVFYGIALFFVWLIYIIMGGITVGISAGAPEQIQSFCDGDSHDMVEWASDTIKTVDDTVNKYSSTLMCSYKCPCSANKAQKWLEIEEDDLNEYGRTKKPVGNTGTLNRDPTKDDDGNYRIVTALTNTYDNFDECNKMLQKKKKEYDQNNPSSRLLQALPANNNQNTPTDDYSYVPTGDIVDTGIKVIQYFEQKYKCSGICTTALFYYSLDLTKGIPRETCLKSLKEEVGDSMTWLGSCTLTVGVICLLIWFLQYVLWCKFDDGEGKHPYAGGVDRN